MHARDSLETSDTGAVFGVAHVGPGEEPYNGWTRKRLTDQELRIAQRP